MQPTVLTDTSPGMSVIREEIFGPVVCAIPFDDGGDPNMVKHKLSVLRGHCDAAQRDYNTIEMTHNNSWLLGRDKAAVAAKRDRLAVRGPLRSFVGTVSEAIDLIGRYQDTGVQLLIDSDYRNGLETHELFASDVMPHFT